MKSVALTISALLILVTIVTLLLLYALRDKPREFLTAEQRVNASAYKALAEEKIGIAYAAKDIEGLAEIFDNAYSVDRVSLWGDPHYDAAQAASNYMSLQRCLPNLDKERISKKEAEEITYYCFYFYYRAYKDDGAEIFDPIRESEIVPLIQTRLGFTVEDMENFRSKVIATGIVNRSDVYRVTKRQFKNYH